MLVAIMEKYNIETKVCSITTDNGSNLVKAFKEFARTAIPNVAGAAVDPMLSLLLAKESEQVEEQENVSEENNSSNSPTESPDYADGILFAIPSSGPAEENYITLPPHNSFKRLSLP